MKFFNMARKYMSPETGGEGQGGGGTPTPEAEAPKPEAESPKPEAEAPKPEVKPEETQLPEKTEDKSKLGQVTSLVEASGLDMKEVAEYAKANDGAIDLDTMVKLKEKHGEAIASLIADQIKGIHAERTAAAQARDNEVFDQVKEMLGGLSSDPNQTGESMWQELAGWAKEETDGKPNVSNEHRKEINAMLAQGGLAAKLAVQELASAFKESIGTEEFQEADLLEADSTPASGAGGNISKSDYNRELNKLLDAGHVYGQSAEITKLDNRRAKSIARGY